MTGVVIPPGTSPEEIAAMKAQIASKADASELAAKANATDVTSALAAKANASAIPQPATTMPPGVSDTGAVGSSQKYALENHTHASKARKVRVLTATDGTYTWTFDPPFTAGVVPIVVAVAEAASGVTDVINVQIVDTPTATSCKLLANRTQRSVATLLGLTILSIPASVGAVRIHAVALEP